MNFSTILLVMISILLTPWPSAAIILEKEGDVTLSASDDNYIVYWEDADTVGKTEDGVIRWTAQSQMVVVNVSSILMVS